MAHPNFVNIGAAGVQGFGTSVTIPLPASLVVGNLLIAAVSINLTAPNPVWPGAWTVIDQDTSAGSNYLAYAYKYVLGGDTAPTVTWTGSQAAGSFMLQFNSTAASSPIGNKNKRAWGGSTTFTGGSLACAGLQSLVLDIEYQNNTGVLQVPAGYSLASTPSVNWEFNTVVIGSGSSPAISYTFASGTGNNTDAQIEILAGGPPNITQAMTVF